MRIADISYEIYNLQDDYNFNLEDCKEINDYIGVDNGIFISQKGGDLDALILNFSLDVLAGISVEIITLIIKALYKKIKEKNKKDKQLPVLKIHAECKKADFNYTIDFNGNDNYEENGKIISDIAKFMYNNSNQD